MANAELLAQIQELQAKGHSKEDIKAQLIKKNWAEEDINGALALIGIPAGPAMQFKVDYVPPKYRTREPFSVLLSWTVAFALLCAAVGEFSYWYETQVLAESGATVAKVVSTATTSVSFMPQTIPSTSGFPTKFGSASSISTSRPLGGGGVATPTTPTTPSTPATTNTPDTTNAPDTTTTPPPATLVTPPPTAGPAPVITLCMDNPNISSGRSVSFTWDATDVSSCTASGGWSGSQSATGSQTFSNITANTTYTLQCTGTDGSTLSKSQTVTVQ